MVFLLYTHSAPTMKPVLWVHSHQFTIYQGPWDLLTIKPSNEEKYHFIFLVERGTQLVTACIHPYNKGLKQSSLAFYKMGWMTNLIKTVSHLHTKGPSDISKCHVSFDGTRALLHEMGVDTKKMGTKTGSPCSTCSMKWICRYKQVSELFCW
jgi:hypothetical protein